MTRWLAGKSLLLLVLGCLTGSASAATTNILWQTKGEGRSAEVQFTDSLGGGRINLLQMSGSTFMFYEIWGNDPTSRVCTQFFDEFGNIITICSFTRSNYDYGWGQIANSDLQFTGTNTTLVVTNGAGFSSTRCVTTTSNAVTTCTSGAPISFNLTWTANPFSGNTIVGANQTAIGPFTFTSTGALVSRSAYVSGTVNGREFSNAPGRVGETKGKNIATVTVP